jgi:catechol 2,3-dioxygenase-like lactoylglutathione lyase family enzyme
MPTIPFLSIFVPDLPKAREQYTSILGVEPIEADEDSIDRHPFAAAGPVVFDLGTIKLALYQCDMRGTHPGDVGIGLSTDESPAEVAARARKAGANVFFGPKPLPGEGRELAVFMTQDRHFFEVVGRGH